jgi:hypothetical protein
MCKSVEGEVVPSPILPSAFWITVLVALVASTSRLIVPENTVEGVPISTWADVELYERKKEQRTKAVRIIGFFLIIFLY